MIYWRLPQLRWRFSFPVLAPERVPGAAACAKRKNWTFSNLRQGARRRFWCQFFAREKAAQSCAFFKRGQIVSELKNWHLPLPFVREFRICSSEISARWHLVYRQNCSKRWSARERHNSPISKNGRLGKKTKARANRPPFWLPLGGVRTLWHFFNPQKCSHFGNFDFQITYQIYKKML